MTSPISPDKHLTGSEQSFADSGPRLSSSRWSRRRLALHAAGLSGLTLSGLGAGLIGGDQAWATARAQGTPVATPTRGGLRDRGISYEIGIDWAPGESSRPSWNLDFVRHDIAVIRDELHCTTVSIFGNDSDRAIEAAAIAQEAGLDVWIQPRLVDGSQEATLEQLTAFARGAEELRQANPNIVLNAGCELSIFMAGIIPGDTYLDRLGTLAESYTDMEAYTTALDDFLQQTTELIRAEFGGTINYGSGF